jgi:predicted membrane channel-forming protein YqfA (hemolysin III family)
VRVLIEVAHVTAGLMVALIVGSLAAWSYPRATNDIWTVTYVAMAAVALMGIGPVRRAFQLDRARLGRARQQGDSSND